MKKILFLLFLLYGTTIFSQNSLDTLRNQTIIKLVKSKISDDIIIQKMNQSICLFNTSIDSLIFLKENLVSDKLIEIMK